MRTTLTMLGLVVLATASGGCNLVAPIFYVFAPTPTKKIEAEFDALKKKTVAVVVYAGPDTQLDYQLAQMELSETVNIELKKRIAGVTTIDCRRVMRYQDENPDWNECPMSRIARAFNADYVLLISLIEFSTREPGSLYLTRGRIRAEASLYPAMPKTAAAPTTASATQPSHPRSVWRTDAITVIHPANPVPNAANAGNEDSVRVETERIFADLLVKRFYKHEIPL